MAAAQPSALCGLCTVVDCALWWTALLWAKDDLEMLAAMTTTTGIGRLAAVMAEGRRSDPPRTIPVLLGEAFARAAGVPAVDDIGREVFRHLAVANEAELRRMCPDWPDTPDSAVASAFKDWLRGLSPARRTTAVEPFYEVPVPLFVRDLADLVVAGHVTSVLTLSADDLLEQALDDAGLRRWHDYVVMVVGGESKRSASAPVRIIKLQGDIGSDLLPVDPGEIEAALRANRAMFRSELREDLIVVGHDQTRPSPIDDWLVRQSAGILWWVAPEPGGSQTSFLQETRPVEYIDGADGEVEAFFGLLATHLIRLPTLNSVSLRSARASNADPLTVPDPQTVREEYERGQLLKAKAVTRMVQQQRVPGVPDPALDSKLNYQRSLELQLVTGGAVVGSALAGSLGTVLGSVVGAVWAAVKAAQSRPEVPPPIVDFLASQAATVEREAKSDSPDLNAVTNAAESVYTVSKGLGELVPGDDVDRLGSALHADRPASADD